MLYIHFDTHTWKCDKCGVRCEQPGADATYPHYDAYPLPPGWIKGVNAQGLHYAHCPDHVNEPEPLRN